MWQNITIKQYQEVINTSGDDLEAEIQRISILEGKSIEDIENLSIGDYNSIKSKWNSIGEPSLNFKNNSFKLNGYKINLIQNAKDINAGQYNEVVHFASGSEQAIVNNLHFILSSISKVYKRNWYGKYEEVKLSFEDKAELLLNAPFIYAFNGVVFFYLVFVKSLESLKDYLVKQMLMMGMSEEQAEKVHTDLLNITVGYSMPAELQNIREYH